MAIYTVHLNRSCTYILVQRHQITCETTGPCNGSGNQSLAFHCKGQSSIADQSMWNSGGQSGSGKSRPSSTSVFLFQYHSTTAPYSNFVRHRHHKILPTHSIFRQHIKKPATSIIAPSSENMDNALDYVFPNMLHQYKGKRNPPCKRHTFLIYLIKQHCTVRFPTTHDYVQTSMMRMWHGNKYIQENFRFPNVTQNVSTKSNPVREITFTLLLPRYARRN